MAGPNSLLDKGFIVAAASTTVTDGLACVLDPAGVGLTVKTVTATTDKPIGIYLETLDDAKKNTGKADVGVRIMGIARCRSGAAIALGDAVKVTALGKVTPTTTANDRVVGIATTAVAAVDQYVDVLLTPGANY
jgi:hypothetical protein